MKRYYRTAEKAVANVMEKAVTNEVNPPLQSQSQELEEMTTIIPIDAEVFDVKDFPSDPGLRKSLSLFNVNLHDAIRREYIQRGPCQPKSHKFPSRAIANTTRKFQPNWFSNFSGWLEYSIEKDAAFCLYCYLFPPELVRGGDAFTSEGFTYWNKGEERFVQHEGKPTGAHFKAYQKYQAFKNQKQDIRNVFHKHSKQSNTEYRIRLNATVDVIRFILRQGLPFQGHDESENSNNRGNFLELLKFLGDHNEEINKVLCNTPKNNKLTHHDIQKQIVNAAAIETTNAIIQDLGDAFFSILVDESRDISVKEQMSVLLSYVDKKGLVIERFLGVVHVPDTTAVTLKSAIDELFSKHNLSFSRVRGQGYDGASNMRGELGGLKTLILMENESAHYIHCFAHQLQLTFVAVAKNHIEVASLFFLLSSIVNVVGASCKRRDQLREMQAATIADQLQIGEIGSGKGLNQETNLKRAGDTRWGSHYGTIINMILMFSSAIDVLGFIELDAVNSEQKAEAAFLIDSMECFEFVFTLHLMKNLLGIASDLSQALQRKDQDILNAMRLLKICKTRLQTVRSSEEEWNSLLNEVSSFCEKHEITIPDMDDKHVVRGRSRRKAPNKTNYEHYRVELFCAILDRQLQELNDRFSEVSTELIISISSLNPKDSFAAYDKEQLICLAKMYPADFSEADCMRLESQLQNYIVDMRSNKSFSDVKGISELVQMLVEMGLSNAYPLVFRLLQLALVLPVATSSVERSFSAMKIVKSRLRNRMEDKWLNDCMVTYVEKDVFDGVSNESIMQRFQKAAHRRGQL